MRVCANHVCLGALVVENIGQKCAVHVRSHHDHHNTIMLKGEDVFQEESYESCKFRVCMTKHEIGHI